MADHNQSMYDRFGEQYHQKRLTVNGGLWNRWLDRPMIESLLSDLPAPLRVLDLGCGSGLLSGWLASQGHKVDGVDFSSGMINIARREQAGIEFHVGDIKAAPLPGDQFDLIVSALVLHYEHELLPVFAEAARLLKPGGRMVFTMHHPVSEVMEVVDHENYTLAHLKPYFDEAPYRWHMFHNKEMELINHHHTLETISCALSGSGFVIEQIREGRMPKEAKDVSPHCYAKTNAFPTFIGFRTKLIKE